MSEVLSSMKSGFGFEASALDAPAGPLVMVAVEAFADEVDQPTHSHARGQLFGSLGGLLSLDLGNHLWVVPNIHAVWLPPRYPHAGKSHGAFNGWSAYVSEEACAALPAAPCTIRTSRLLREAVLRAATWRGGPLDGQRGNLASVILDEIRTLPQEPFGLPLPREARLKRIAHALITSPADDKDLGDWAEWAAIGARTLTRRFKAETGFSFAVWRQRARLLRSLELLAADVPVGTMALDLGWSTASAFITQFRKTFGETPAAYRHRL